MNRTELLKVLAMCDRHIAQGHRNIAEQESRIDAMEAAGRDAWFSKTLLETFKQLMRSHEGHRDAVIRELAALHTAWQLNEKRACYFVRPLADANAGGNRDGRAIHPEPR